MKNGDMIRSMQNDALAEFLIAYPCQVCDARMGKPPFCDDWQYRCRECVKDWLEKEVKQPF